MEITERHKTPGTPALETSAFPPLITTTYESNIVVPFPHAFAGSPTNIINIGVAINNA